MEHPQGAANKQVLDGGIDPSVWIRTVCRKNGLEIAGNQIAQLGQYVSLLLDWNTKINLISRRDVENVWQSHIAHALSPLFKIGLPEKARVLDLGTGGGLPGIPWSILLPTISLTMIDATQKKVNAVQSMLGQLGLSHARALWGRADELGRKHEMAGKFDCVVARAVGALDELARLASPFLDPKSAGASTHGEGRVVRGPALLAFKGGEIDEEIRRTKRIKEVESIEIISLAFDGGDPIVLTDKKLAIVKFSKDLP